MDKNKLYCPVRRLEKPSTSIKIEKGNDDLLNIKADVKIKDPIKIIEPILNDFYNKFKNFVERGKNNE